MGASSLLSETSILKVLLGKFLYQSEELLIL